MSNWPATACDCTSFQWLQLTLSTANQVLYPCFLRSPDLTTGVRDGSAGRFALLTNVSNTMQVALNMQAVDGILVLLMLMTWPAVSRPMGHVRAHIRRACLMQMIVVLHRSRSARSCRYLVRSGCTPRTGCWVRSRARTTISGAISTISCQVSTIAVRTDFCRPSSQLSCRCSQGDRSPLCMCPQFIVRRIDVKSRWMQAGGGAVKSLATAAGNGLQYVQQVFSNSRCILSIDCMVLLEALV